MIDYILKYDEKEHYFDQIQNGIFEFDLSEKESKLKSDIEFELSKIQYDKKHRYDYDVKMGAALYVSFNKNKIGLRQLSDKNFWEYMSIKILPKYVFERHNLEEHRYFAKPSLNRVWLYSSWCYFNLSFNNNVDDTIKMLSSNNFSTDTILNLVDRKGDGYNIELYRKIIKAYSNVDTKKSDKGLDAQHTFRFIMVLITAHSGIIEPKFYKDGINGYVNYIFDSAGVKINE